MAKEKEQEVTLRPAPKRANLVGLVNRNNFSVVVTLASGESLMLPPSGTTQRDIADNLITQLPSGVQIIR